MATEKNVFAEVSVHVEASQADPLMGSRCAGDNLMSSLLRWSHRVYITHNAFQLCIWCNKIHPWSGGSNVHKTCVCYLVS